MQPFFFLIYFSYFVPCHGAFMFALLSEILLCHVCSITEITTNHTRRFQFSLPSHTKELEGCTMSL